MKRIKTLAVTCLTGALILSGCSSKEEVSKESIIDETIQALKEVKSYESEVETSENLTLKIDSDTIKIKTSAKGTSMVDIKGKKARYSQQAKQSLSSDEVKQDEDSSEYDIEAYIDFDEGTVQEIINEEENDGDTDTFIADGDIDELLEAMKENEDIDFSENDDTYVLSGEMEATYLHHLMGYDYYHYASKEEMSDRDLKKASIDVEFIIDKKTKLPKSVETDCKEYAEIFYSKLTMGEDEGIKLKKAEVKIEYVEYNEVDSKKVSSLFDDKDIKKVKSKDDQEEDKEKDSENDSSNQEEKEEKEVENVNSKNTKGATGAWDEYAFIVNGTTYKLPVEVSKFQEFGFSIGTDSALADMEGESYRSTNMFSKETMENAWVIIHNPSKETKPVSECVVVRLEVSIDSLSKKHSFELPGGVKLGMSEAELNEAYKEYTSFSFSKPVGMYRYGEEYGTFVKVHVRRDKDIVYKFRVSYEGLGN